MLQAMNTGHDGSLSTLHANSPRDALARVETMVLMAGRRPADASDPRAGGLGDRPPRAHQPPARRHPRVTRVCGVDGMEGDIVTLTDIFHFEAAPRSTGGRRVTPGDRDPAEVRRTPARLGRVAPERHLRRRAGNAASGRDPAGTEIAATSSVAGAPAGSRRARSRRGEVRLLRRHRCLLVRQAGWVLRRVEELPDVERRRSEVAGARADARHHPFDVGGRRRRERVAREAVAVVRAGRITARSARPDPCTTLSVT